MSADALPAVNAYLAGLPKGLASYPECRAHRSLLEGLVRDHGDVAEHPGLPEPARRLLTRGVRHDTWLSEVEFQAANLAIRDVAFQDDAAFIKWSRDWSAELLDKPVLKHLMRLLSPTLVVAGAAKRWRVIHTGSILDARLVDTGGHRARSVARLSFPPGLFPPLFIRALVDVFEAAVAGARGRDTRVELVTQDETHAEYETSWES